jgi:hypothetical protein
MSSLKKVIAWQKYESMLEEQINSPLLSTLLSAAMKNDDENEAGNDSEEFYTEYEKGQEETQDYSPMLPISTRLLEDIAMLSNFNCWMGHTNFDITPEIKRILDRAEGVELLKVCSRYRFFIGVGKLFDFQKIRKTIESQIIEKENL